MKYSLVAPNIQMLGLIEDLLKEGKTVRLKVKGSSMYPLLKDDLTQVDLSSPLSKEIKPGAVVLFRYGEGFILHRIIVRKDNNLVIRGDNLFQPLEFAEIKDVIAMVRNIIQPSGSVIQSNSLRWKLISQSWLMIRPFLKGILVVKNRIKTMD
jgi:phage repressor protein C with HTH and peptisase S24 domain